MYAENDACFTMQMRKRQVYMEGMEAKQNFVVFYQLKLTKILSSLSVFYLTDGIIAI